jgi:hypothetical protein
MADGDLDAANLNLNSRARVIIKRRIIAGGVRRNLSEVKGNLGETAVVLDLPLLDVLRLESCRPPLERSSRLRPAPTRIVKKAARQRRVQKDILIVRDLEWRVI